MGKSTSVEGCLADSQRLNLGLDAGYHETMTILIEANDRMPFTGELSGLTWICCDGGFRGSSSVMLASAFAMDRRSL